MPVLPYLTHLNISGFRGFNKPKQITFATPNGRPGGRLTTLVGPNNGGKSAILEAIDLGARPSPASIPKTARHDASDYLARLELLWAGGSSTIVESDPSNQQAVKVQRKPGPDRKST